MASTKFFLDLRGNAKDGMGSILISLCHNSTCAKFATGIRVSPKNWNEKKVIGIDGFEAININLEKQKLKIDKAIALLSLSDAFDSMTASEIKQAIEFKKPEKKSVHLIHDVFQEYMDTGNLQEGSKHLYRSALKRITDFSGERLAIEDMDFKWLRTFDSYLAKTQSTNGKAIYLRHLRAVMNYAIRSGISCPYPFGKYKIKQEATKKRCVCVEKLREFYYFNCRPSQVRYRDYFFLMFFLIGINAKDLFLAKPDAVSRGRFEYTRNKTHKGYSIKIEPEAKELLDRYKGENYLVEAMDHCKDYHNFLHEMNDALGMIGPEVSEEIPSDDLFVEPRTIKKIEPIIPDITSYFSRHTWATLAYEIGIPFEVISQALGHSIGNKTTMIYVKQDPKKVDDANRKVIDYFFGK